MVLEDKQALMEEKEPDMTLELSLREYPNFRGMKKRIGSWIDMEVPLKYLGEMDKERIRRYIFRDLEEQNLRELNDTDRLEIGLFLKEKEYKIRLHRRGKFSFPEEDSEAEEEAEEKRKTEDWFGAIPTGPPGDYTDAYMAGFGPDFTLTLTTVRYPSRRAMKQRVTKWLREDIPGKWLTEEAREPLEQKILTKLDDPDLWSQGNTGWLEVGIFVKKEEPLITPHLKWKPPCSSKESE